MVEKALTQPAAALASAPLTTSRPVDEEGDVSAVAFLSHGEVVTSKRKGRRRRARRLRARDQTVIATKEGKAEVIREAEVVDQNSVETNSVLRKLLRGPRYFDLSNSSWSNCFNCGEEGHVAVFCTSQMNKKKQKPCFVCGSLVHGGKQCSKARACYICKQIGHLARGCPDKEKFGLGASIICLKCGQSGHEMFSCKNNYSPSDLKEIQCYICRSFGHVCCVDSVDIHSSNVSCYRCGQLGHTGLTCSRQRGNRNEGEKTPSSCFRSGEEGHTSKECKNPSKGEATPSLIYNCGEGEDLSREGKRLTKMCPVEEEEEAKTNSGHNCGVREHFTQAKIQKRKRCDDEEEHKGVQSEPKNLKTNERKKQEDKKIIPQKPPKSNGESIKAEPGTKSFRKSNKNSSTSSRKPSNTTGPVIKTNPREKSFRQSNKNSWRSSPPKPSYAGHMVTRVAPGDQIYNRQYSDDMVSNGTPYHHHYSYNSQYCHQSAAADITLGGQVPQCPTGHIDQPQSSARPHMFQYRASAYPDSPTSPHISSYNLHRFQLGNPSAYDDSPHIFSPNPHVFQYGASAYQGLPSISHISSSNPHRFQHEDSLAYWGSRRSPYISSNPHRYQYGDSAAYQGSPRSPPGISFHRFEYGDSSAYQGPPRSPQHISSNPHRFQYGDSSAYWGSPRSPHLSSNPRMSEYGDPLAYRVLPSLSPHIPSSPHRFLDGDSTYLGSLGTPQPNSASPSWNRGSNRSRRNHGW